MSLHLTVAGSLEPLVDALAEVLARPLADPFATELVVVPSDGLAAWLDARLAHRLGAVPGLHNGIAANIEHTFPATIVSRALGDAEALGTWGTGPLTWAVHDILRDAGAEFGQSADVLRARSIADLLDRYSLHRSTMVQRWSAHDDVDAFGAALPELQSWQPRLWRAVQAQLGGPTDAERIARCAAAVRAGSLDLRAERGFPDRLTVFGLASLPASHLDVLMAVSTQLEVRVLATTPSVERWSAVRSRLTLPLRPPEPRSDETLPVVVGHPLISSWGRASREAHVLLLDAAAQVDSEVTVIAAPATTTATTEPSTPATLLQQLRSDLAADRPVAAAGHDRPTFDPTDRSVQWHRAHGPARQVEILRDLLLHLLDAPSAEGLDPHQLLEPRDIAVLCTDVARFAPLIEATFAGDPDHGVPAIPVRIADRTLRQDNPLLDTIGALLDLLDGRFRLSQVLDFASRPPVQLRFGLDPSALATLESWAVATNVHWGLSAADQEAFGLPSDLHAHTFADGLDQLLVGSVMADAGPRLVFDTVVPFPDIEGAGVAVAGAFAQLVHVLERSSAALREPATVVEWSERLLTAVHELCEVPDDEAWRWQSVDRTITTFADESRLHAAPRTAVFEPVELSALLRARLDAGGGRPRFGTGAVTVSSLTAQRGIPHRVVCLLGLDDDLGSGAIASTDDLVAAQPCIGDRDPRSEQRAQLLDAVLAASERLVLLSTGRDIRTNVPLAAPVAVAELLEVLDRTMQAPGSARVSSLITIDHPRQAWSDLAFVPGALGFPEAWSFDRGALLAAAARRSSETPVPFLDQPLPALAVDAPTPLSALITVVKEPVQLLLRDRLGLAVSERETTDDDRIPLTLGGLDEWAIAEQLIRARLADDPSRPPDPHWRRIERARGSVPPGTFGDTVLDTIGTRVESLRRAFLDELGARDPHPRTVAVRIELPVDTAVRAGLSSFDPRTIEGNVADVHDDLILTVSPSRPKDHGILSALIRVAALTLHDPATTHCAVTIGRAPSSSKQHGGIVVQRVSLADPDDAAEVLAVFLDLVRRASADAVPAFASTTRALHRDDAKAAGDAWSPHGSGGERRSRFTAFIPDFQCDLHELLQLPPRHDERWAGPGRPRLEQWAERLWGTVDRLAVVVEETIGGDADSDADPSDGSSDAGADA